MIDANTNFPKVSVLIPVYNREEFISDCIQSALNQTYQNFEVIVVDNDSSDRTWDICQQFASNDKRVKAYRNETNIGAVRNWQRCISLANGVYGKILFSDDLILPEYLEKTVPLLIDDSSCGFVYTAAEIFSEFGVITANAYVSDAEVMKSDEFIKRSLKDLNTPVSPGCAIFRIDDLRKNLLLSVPNRANVDITEKGAGSDLLIFLMTAKDYDHVKIVNESLSRFRAHPGSITIHEQTGITPYYDLAKIWFVSKYSGNKKLLAEINTLVYFRAKLRKPKVQGLTSLKDYYPGNEVDFPIRIILLAKLITISLMRMGWRVIKKVLRITDKARVKLGIK